MTPKWRERALHWLGIAIVAAVLVAAGMIAGWRLAGASLSETAIGRVSFEIGPALSGDAEAFIPVADWGLRADAFDAPFEIRAELRSLERSAATRAAEGDLSVLEAAEADLRDGARSAVVRAFAWGAALIAVLIAIATLIWRRLRPRWALATLGGALAIAAGGGSMVAAQATFDPRAFESPTYFAQGDELARILELAEDERARSRYGSTFASVLRGVSAILVREPTEAITSRTLYLASDLHANPLVIGPLADAMGDAPILLAGDFGQRGGEAEAELLSPRVAALGERVIAVSGNHDTRGLMTELVADGVTVLGDRGRLTRSGSYLGSPLVAIDGLTVAGFSDPFEWKGETDSPARPITFADLPDPEASLERETAKLIDWFDRLPRRPELVAVHQNVLAQALASELFERGDAGALTILTGHDHRQHIDRYGDIVVVDGGSVGAGGIFDAGRQAVGLAQLHFPTSAARLRSVDLIAIEPFSGQAQASRVVIEALCPDEKRCSFEPPGLEPAPSAE